MLTGVNEGDAQIFDAQRKTASKCTRDARTYDDLRAKTGHAVGRPVGTKRFKLGLSGQLIMH